MMIRTMEISPVAGPEVAGIEFVSTQVHRYFNVSALHRSMYSAAASGEGGGRILGDGRVC